MKIRPIICCVHIIVVAFMAFIPSLTVSTHIYKKNVSIKTQPVFQNTGTITNEGPSSKPVIKDIADEKLVVYNGPIQHIFFHPLIAYPELSFDGDSISQGYDDWFVTVKEFNRILDSLYEKDFMLIDINRVYVEKEENNKSILKKRELLLPRNKKPLIISIDDLNYYDYMIENGNVHKLILDEDGNIATYSVSPDGEKIISRDNEIVPILDKFVEGHKDFSYAGAKGTIALTGFHGVLGYRTDKSNTSAYQDEIKNVLPVIKRMKETGWSFASHGYGHLDAKKTSYEKLVNDTLKWSDEVEPLIGPTSIYIYPYGSEVFPSDPKFQFLVESGFNTLCSVGPGDLNIYNPNYITMERRNIDGFAFRNRSDKLLDLFDTNTVIDSARPK